MFTKSCGIFLICLSLYVPNNLSASDIFYILSKIEIIPFDILSKMNTEISNMYYTVFFKKIPHDFVNKMRYCPFYPIFLLLCFGQKCTQALSVRLQALEFRFSQNLIDGNRRAVGKVQASLIRKHGDAYASVKMR